MHSTNMFKVNQVRMSQFIRRISFETPVSPPARAGEEERKISWNRNICFLNYSEKEKLKSKM